MDEQYDVAVLGTGLVECILSSLLAMDGKKVLHMDRNDYYGGECASLNLAQEPLMQLFKKFGNGREPPKEYGRDRDYNIDLVPKFMMAAGELVKVLIYTDVTRYIEFQQIAGSYVYREGKISKVPSTEMEALTSPLMGFFEKRRAKKFFEFIQTYKENDPSSHQGINLEKETMKQVYERFGLEPGTQDFMGHSLALHLNDSYLEKPAKMTYQKILLYMTSLARYGKSPYIYPMYGLGELSQGFARLSAIYGGTYMLDKKVDGLVYENGVVSGVKCGDEIAKCKAVIGDPTYFPDKVKSIGKIVRVICLLRQPIPNTDNSDSVQLIIPQRQLGRKSDIYIAAVSSTHQVCAKGFYVAIVSTICETSNPEKEVEPALALLGPICEKFVTITDIFEPLSNGSSDQVFISKTFDATSHFETVCNDVLDLYTRITGMKLDLNNPPKRPGQE